MAAHVNEKHLPGRICLCPPVWLSSSKCSVSHHCRCEAMSGLSWLKSFNDWDRVSDKLVLYNKNTFLRKILQSQCRKDTGMITHPGKTLGKVQHVASRSHNAMDQHTCWGWSVNATLGGPLDLLECKIVTPSKHSAAHPSLQLWNNIPTRGPCTSSCARRPNCPVGPLRSGAKGLLERMFP